MKTTIRVDSTIALRLFVCAFTVAMLVSLGAEGQARRKSKDASKSAEIKVSDKWENVLEKIKELPPELDEKEKKLAEKRWESIRKAYLTTDNPLLASEFNAFWTELRKVCDRPDIQFKLFVLKSDATLCRVFSDGSIFVTTRVLEMIDAQEWLNTQWPQEIAHIVMQHPSAVHRREVEAKTAAIVVSILFAAAGTAISMNNPMTSTSGGMTYNQYYVFYPNPVWVGGVVQAQPPPLFFAYEPNEELFSARLALQYLNASGQRPGRLLEQMRSVNDNRLGDLTAFAQGLGSDVVLAQDVHKAASIPALLDMALLTYESQGEVDSMPSNILYPTLRIEREPAGYVDLSVAVPKAVQHKFLSEKTKAVFEAESDACRKKYNALLDEPNTLDGKAALSILNEAFSATTTGNLEIEKAWLSARAELQKEILDAAKKIAKKGSLKTIYAVDQRHAPKLGVKDLTAEFQNEFHLLDNYR